jgi:hypothetical protein
MLELNLKRFSCSLLESHLYLHNILWTIDSNITSLEVLYEYKTDILFTQYV